LANRRQALRIELDKALVRGEEEVVTRRRRLLRKGGSVRLEEEIRLINEEAERLRKARVFLIP
jgi:hypothetical protein